MAVPNSIQALVGNMTLAELSTKTGRSLASIVDFAIGSATLNRAATSSPKPANGKSTVQNGRSFKDVNTRTQSGREAYDAAIEAVVRSAKGPILATQIRAKVGGTPQQARTALHRLIEAGTITHMGQARATKYMMG